MSLLLEALKRAEDKGRRRQAGAVSGVAGVLPQDRLAAGAGPLPALDLHGPGEDELSVELTTAPPVDPPDPLPAAIGAPAAPTWEPELALASAPAPLAPPSVAPPPAVPSPARRSPPPARTPPQPPAAPRPAVSDARAAQRLMQAQARPEGGRGRQAWLLAAVALLGAGVAALWFWPETPPPPRRPPLQPPMAAAPVPAEAAAPVVATPPVAPLPDAAASSTVLAALPVPAASLPAAPAQALAGAPPAVATPATPATPAPPAPPVAEAKAPSRADPGVRAAVRPPAGIPARRPAAAAVTSSAEAPASTPAEPSPRQAAAAQVQQQLQQAYADFQAGRTQEATQAWRDVVRVDPTQRDAWLGLAISAHRQGQRDSALSAYQQVLRLDPDNGEAVAAIAALEAAGSDSASESRLREALNRNPGNAMFNSALARLLSGQGRWDEAQPFWFAAHAAAPDQAAHAYNLAVALDRLRKAPLAAQYYRKALELQQGRASAFDVEAARARLQVLEGAARGGTP